MITSDLSQPTKVSWRAVKTESVHSYYKELSVTSMPMYIVIGVEEVLKIIDRPTQRVAEQDIPSEVNEDLLLDNTTALIALYSEFTDEEQELANIGIEHYAKIIELEENTG